MRDSQGNLTCALLEKLVRCISCCESLSDNRSFLDDLAAKMAAGPPKGPVGLVKKPTLDAKSLSQPTQPSEAEKKLGSLLKATVSDISPANTLNKPEPSNGQQN